MLASNRIVAFIPTSRPEESKRFFMETLGLALQSEDPFALVFDANGIMLRVVKVGKFTPQQFTVVGWETRDITETVTQLAGKGVKFERYGLPGQDESGIWTAPGDKDKVAWFKDPDGNVLSISQHG